MPEPDFAQRGNAALTNLRVWQFAISMVLCLLYLIVDKKFSPDYQAYYAMFHGLQAVDGSLAMLGITMQVVYAVSGDNFDTYLSTCVIFGSFICWLALKRLSDQEAGPAISRLPYFSMLLFALATFLLEFYVVRLRAGLSIAFFLLLIIQLLTLGGRKKPILALGISMIFGVISFAYHSQTFLVLCVFLLAPLLLHNISFRPRAVELIAFASVMLAGWCLFFYALDGSWVRRGAYLRSPLNDFRLFLSAVVPLGMLILIVSTGERQSEFSRFPRFFVYNYCCAALVLLIFHWLGFLRYDGEAVVRVMTLSSLGALVCLIRWRSSAFTLISGYLLLCNGAFFLNTIFLQITY